MQKTQVEEEKTVKAVVSLAFRVIPDAEGLFAAEMLMLVDDMVVEKRHGSYTTLGHAIGAADDLLDGWAFSAIETKPEAYFKDVFL